MSDILMRPIIAMQVAVHQLREREDGQTTTEYAILLGFLAIAIIVALLFLQDILRSLFSSAASSVSGAPGGLGQRPPKRTSRAYGPHTRAVRLLSRVLKRLVQPARLQLAPLDPQVAREV